MHQREGANRHDTNRRMSDGPHIIAALRFEMFRIHILSCKVIRAVLISTPAKGNDAADRRGSFFFFPPFDALFTLAARGGRHGCLVVRIERLQTPTQCQIDKQRPRSSFAQENKQEKNQKQKQGPGRSLVWSVIPVWKRRRALCLDRRRIVGSKRRTGGRLQRPGRGEERTRCLRPEYDGQRSLNP